MRSRQAFPSLDYTPPSRLPKGRSGGESRTMVKLLKRLKVGRGTVAMFRGAYVFDAVRPPSRLLFPSYRTGEETMLSDFRKLLDAVAARAGWQRGEIRSKMFRDRKSTRLNSSHRTISYAVFCLKKKNS